MSRKQRKAKPARSNQRSFQPQQAESEPTLGFWKKASPLQPMNEIQSHYMESIRTCPYVFATGYAGTSKTYIPTRMFASWLQAGDIDKLIIARPAASMSNSLGYFKGDAVEKMMMWIAPVLDALKEELNPTFIEYALKYELIMAVPLETIKGRSFKNCGIIIDEAEDLTSKEVKALMTRLGTNSTMVFAGDINQVDIAYSGLGKFLDAADRNDRLANLISHIDFCDHDDIVRSEAVKEAIIGMEEIGF